MLTSITMIDNDLTIFNKLAGQILREEPIWQANDPGIFNTIDRPCRATIVAAIDGALLSS